MYGDVDLGACVWCQERSVWCLIAQRGRVGKSSGEKRKRSEKGKEKAEGSSDEEDSSDEEPLVKKAKVAEVVAEDTPVPQLGSGEVDQPNEVEDRVEGEAEQPRVAEGLGQGAREARPDEATLVVALRELTKVCRRGFDDMREGLAELHEDSWILRTAAVEYLEERRRKNLNRLGDWAREREESSEGGSECNYDWA